MTACVANQNWAYSRNIDLVQRTGNWQFFDDGIACTPFEARRTLGATGTYTGNCATITYSGATASITILGMSHMGVNGQGWSANRLGAIIQTNSGLILANIPPLFCHYSAAAGAGTFTTNP